MYLTCIEHIEVRVREKVQQAFSRQFREVLPMELLYADGLVLMAETEELLVEKIQKRNEYGG